MRCLPAPCTGLYGCIRQHSLLISNLLCCRRQCGLNHLSVCCCVIYSMNMHAILLNILSPSTFAYQVTTWCVCTVVFVHFPNGCSFNYECMLGWFLPG